MTELTQAQEQDIRELLSAMAYEDDGWFGRAEHAITVLQSCNAALRTRLEQVEQVRDEHYAAYIEATESEERLRGERDASQDRVKKLEARLEEFRDSTTLTTRLAQMEDMANAREAFYAGELNAAEELRCAQRDRLAQMEAANAVLQNNNASLHQTIAVRDLTIIALERGKNLLQAKLNLALLTPAVEKEAG